MHLRGKAMMLEALLPTGQKQVISLVSDFNFNWMTTYVYADDAAPLLPKGTIIKVTAWHDNTSANAANPDPNVWVGYGDRTVDEMAHAWMNCVYLSDEDYNALLADFGTPDFINAAAKQAIDQHFSKYTPVGGTAELKRAICDRYRADYGVDYRENQVITCAGGKQALFNTALALFGPGDEVIVHAPYWPTLPEQVKLAEATPIVVPTAAADGFAITADALLRALTPRTRGIIINSPCNPTGAVIAEGELRKIVEWCASRDCFLMFDETYEFFVYNGAEHVSAARWMNEYPETVVVVNSMSKTFAMTGWRLGYAVAHRDIVSAANKIQSHSTSNPSSISQAAALEALSGDNDADVIDDPRSTAHGSVPTDATRAVIEDVIRELEFQSPERWAPMIEKLRRAL
jgi:aspartate/methionine/tyrosine aminotransferase